MRLRRRTLGDEVYEAVRARIMDQSIAPGARVGIDSLARDLDVSPTPVREALARLEADGLVSKRAMVGYSTTPLLNRDEFEHLFEVRLILEPPAAAKAAESGVEISADLGIAADDGSAAFTAADAAFHEEVVTASGNPLLADCLIRLHAHLHLQRLYLPLDPVRVTAVEHHAIATAIAARNSDGAAQAMVAHLVAARDRHRRYWESP